MCECVNCIELNHIQVQMAGFCENGNEISDSMKSCEFLDHPKFIKVNVKVSLCLSKNHAMKTYWV